MDRREQEGRCTRFHYQQGDHSERHDECGEVDQEEVEVHHICFEECFDTFASCVLFKLVQFGYIFQILMLSIFFHKILIPLRRFFSKLRIELIICTGAMSTLTLDPADSISTNTSKIGNPWRIFITGRPPRLWKSKPTYINVIMYWICEASTRFWHLIGTNFPVLASNLKAMLPTSLANLKCWITKGRNCPVYMKITGAE